MQVQINIVLAVLLFCLLVHAYLRMNRKATNILFIWIMMITCVVLLLEVASVLINQPGQTQWIVLNKMVNMLGFIITPFIPYLGYVFCEKWILRFKTNKNSGRLPIRWPAILLTLPLVINGIAAMLSLCSGWMFRIDSSNVYVRGTLFFILPAVSFFYIALSIVFIFRHIREFSIAERVLFIAFFSVPMFSTIIQIINRIQLTTWNSAAFVIIIVYIFILNDQVYRDSMTGLENRQAYENYTQKINPKKMSRICMIYMDIDNFKTINDQYGHMAGDQAIRIFADLIVDSFTLDHKRIMRFGGDEFLIIMEEPEQVKIQDCLDRFNESIKIFNDSGIQPYLLDFSYGLGRFTDELENLDQLMDHIDHLMYEDKQRKKS